MRHFLLIAALLCCCGVARASAPVVLQQDAGGVACEGTAGIVGATCALPGNLTPGSTLSLVVKAVTAVNRPTGCGLTWVVFPLNDTFAGPQQSFMYFAQNPSSSSSCTVTLTASGTVSVNMKLVEYGGAVAAYPFNFFSPWQYLSTTSITIPFLTNCTSCLAVTFANVTCDPHTFTGSGGWTGLVPSGISGTDGIIGYTRTISAAGAYSNTMNGTCSIGGSGFILQSVLPSVGRIQQNVCASATATVNCAFLFPPTAGDAYIVTPSCAASGLQYTFSNNASLTPRLLPGFSFFVDSYFFPNVPSTVPTFTAAFSGGGGNCTAFANMFITEVRGLSTTGAYANGSQNYDLLNTFGGGSTTSWNSTPVTIYQPGTYYLYCPVAQVFNQFITPGSGWGMGLEDTPGQPTLTAMFDQTVSIATPTAFDCGITYPDAESSPDVALYAFGTAPYTLPQIAQTISNLAPTATWLNPVQNGSDLVFNSQATTNASGPWVYSQSCGGTTAPVLNASSTQIGCGNSDQFCPFVANNVTGGTCGFTVTKNGVTAFTTAGEVTGVTAIQGGNFGTSAGTFPVSTGNVTTTNPTTELIVFCTAGYSESTSTVVPGTDTTFTQSQQAAIDQAGNWLNAKTVFGAGTFSDTCNGIPTSTFRSALIVPLTLTPIIVNTQPHVTIALNGKDIPAYQIGAQ